MAEATAEFRAAAKWIRVSPQKARLVLDLIKGRRVEDALNTLTFTKKRVAAQVYKVLRSALDNANYLSTEKGAEVDVDRLYVKRAVANDGPRMKRIRPAPQGRAYRYQRRMSHIEVALAEKARPATAAPAETATATAKAPRKTAKKPAAKKPAAKKPAGKKPTAKKAVGKK
jgi:large subunit ribosomal protein L22